jgi:alanine racemase
MQYTPIDIAKICHGKLVTKLKAPLAPVGSLYYDTRSITLPENSLFIAIKSTSGDGHRFIPDAYNKGVRYFLVEKIGEKYEKLAGAVFIVVPDALKALQAWAAHHRQQFKIPVVGITGSNGKTIVKEWLFQLTAPDKAVVRSPKSYNSQLGVPLSVLQMNEKHQLAIFEAGISKPGEMALLADIIKPTLGIVTNIGEAHSENFESKEQKATEKLQLIAQADKVVINADQKLLVSALQKSKLAKPGNLISWGKKKGNNVVVTQVKKSKTATIVNYSYAKKEHSFILPFVDEASVENAMQCLSAALMLGFKPAVLNERMQHLSPVAMRLELKQGLNNCTLINDAYNSDIESLNIALNFLDRQKQQPKKTLILSDIEQSGLADKELYKLVHQMLKQHKVDRLIGIGTHISKQKKLFGKHTRFFDSTDAFIESFADLRFEHETILLKGSRSFEFERIVRLLQQKSHQTILEINLNALISNLNYFRSLLKPDTKVMAMVKALSYGSGSYEVANVLQHHKIDYLAVAYADEGVELRRNGITVPIMVMNPEPQTFEVIVEHKLEPIVYSFGLLHDFAKFLERNHKKHKQFPIHLELETGMKRLGFEADEMAALVKELKKNSTLKVVSCFSHLAAADEAQHDAFTQEQIDLFERLTQQLKKGIGYDFMRHILNSAGIYRFTKAQYNMVRLGIGLYGVGVDVNEQRNLQPVSRLKSIISQIKQVKKGETVGYGRKGKTNTNITIATVPIGYADGVSRTLSNGKGSFWVNGSLCPIIGNVCMDMTMIDISTAKAQEGDEVEVFGEHHTILKVAEDLNTIPYEVLTDVSARVKRVYFQE